MKHIVIVNQKTRGKRLEQLIREMKETFEKRKLNYEIHYTGEPHCGCDIIHAQDHPCRFYICGGDGTLHKAINSLQGSQHELVLIPCGTGNDFSRMLKHHKDIFAHFRDSLHRKAKRIDLLKINDHYCINAACFAWDADIGNHVHDANWKYIPKKIAYIITILRRLFVYRCNDVHVEIDGKPFYQGKVLFFTCNNAKYYGGGFCLTPNAKINDGKMDVCLIRAFPRWSILPKVPFLLLQKPERIKECSTLQCRQMHVTSSQGMNLDGETYSDMNIQIDLLPNALLLVNEF